MKKFLASVLLLWSINTLNPAAAAAVAAEAAPFPQAQLDKAILESFLPAIMAECEEEFALQNDDRTRRHTRQWGFSYFNMIRGTFSYEEPPAFLQELGAAICRTLGHEPKKFTNIILSRYEAGFHLEPHVDVHEGHVDAKGFYFNENVYGIVVEADPTGHLYFVRHEGDALPQLDLPHVYDLDEKAGSIFCLQGVYRRAPLYHAVSEVSRRRISITFRTVTRF